MSVQVLMDVGPAVHQSAGLARYTERLATHLLSGQTHRVSLSLFYNAHDDHHPPTSLAQAPSYPFSMGQVAWRLSVLASQIMHVPYQPLVQLLGRCGPSALYHATEHLLPRLSVPTVLTVHDLIFERYPQHHTRLNRLFLHTGMPLFVKAASAVIAVSAHTKRDLVELYHAPGDKIHVVHEGIDVRFGLAAPDEVQRVHAHYSPGRPYLLMVGTLEPRKNHATALDALARLKAEGFPHRLLVVGGKGWLFEPIRQLVERLGLAGDVSFAGYVPDADLPALYTGAACVLAPSLYEGFGFPVLEAMACGAAVVCSNVSSLPEVAGDAALLVPPTDAEALAHAVRLVLTQPVLTQVLRQRGRARAGLFRWERCAASTADLYAEVANWSRRPRPS